MLAVAPNFPQVYELLVEILRNRMVIIYNASFDHRMLLQNCKLHEIEFEAFDTNCAMLMYSQWCGDWDYRRRNYRWQKLPGGDHSSLGDCRATLEIIKEMAASLKKEVK
jgi:DNA polymerase-3 subunit epsilon